jgi:hypothetical protein
LIDPQGRKTRVEEINITQLHLNDTTWAVREIAATQAATGNEGFELPVVN